MLCDLYIGAGIEMNITVIIVIICVVIVVALVGIVIGIVEVEIEIDIATWIGIHQGDIDGVLVVAWVVVGAQLHIVIGLAPQFQSREFYAEEEPPYAKRYV